VNPTEILVSFLAPFNTGHLIFIGCRILWDFGSAVPVHFTDHLFPHVTGVCDRSNQPARCHNLDPEFVTPLIAFTGRKFNFHIFYIFIIINIIIS
jgi:hypothetical protein